MEFAEIFLAMDTLSLVLLAVGAVFILIEVFVPGFGFFGITGTLSLIGGVVSRIYHGLNITQSLTLVLIVIGFFTIGALLMVVSAQYGILSHTGLFETGTSLPQNYSNVDRQIKRLIGKSGKAVTDLNLSGKAKIKGEIYDVMSINSYIKVGQHVKVIGIKDNTILVRKWFE